MRRHGDKGAKEPVSLGLSAALAECPAYEAWGAFVDDRLAAYMVTLWVEDWAHILVERSTTALLKHYPNNALVYTVTNELLSRPGVEVVSYGWEPLSASHASLEQFKLSMGFSKEAVRQCIVLRPWLRPLANRPIRHAIGRLAAMKPDTHRLQQVAGMLRFLGK
jgi:hypothetical protein